MENEIQWPARPAPLSRGDGIQWHITRAERGDGRLILYCNERPFAIIARNALGEWVTPAGAKCVTHLQAMQTAAREFLGNETKYETLVSA